MSDERCYFKLSKREHCFGVLDALKFLSGITAALLSDNFWSSHLIQQVSIMYPLQAEL